MTDNENPEYDARAVQVQYKPGEVAFSVQVEIDFGRERYRMDNGEWKKLERLKPNVILDRRSIDNDCEE